MQGQGDEIWNDIFDYQDYWFRSKGIAKIQ